MLCWTILLSPPLLHHLGTRKDYMTGLLVSHASSHEPGRLYSFQFSNTRIVAPTNWPACHIIMDILWCVYMCMLLVCIWISKLKSNTMYMGTHKTHKMYWLVKIFPWVRVSFLFILCFPVCDYIEIWIPSFTLHVIYQIERGSSNCREEVKVTPAKIWLGS